MKKSIFSLLLLVFAATAFAQENTFNKGDKVLNLGIGLGSTLYTGGYYKSAIPPLSASLEYGVKDNLFDEKSSLGIGGYFGYTSAKWEYSGYGWNYSSMILGARGALHYQLVDKLDTYTGILLGYNIVSSKSFGSLGEGTNYTAAASGIAWSWFLGGRYYFTDKLAAMAELGYGISYLNLGIALKL